MAKGYDNPVKQKEQQKRLDQQDWEGIGTGPRLPSPAEEERKQKRNKE